MIRNLKTLGLALVAVFAMSAVVASAASATNDVFESESVPVTLTGEQEKDANGVLNQFTLAGQAVSCVTATYHATIKTSPVSEVTGIVPHYTNCTYAGKTATVHMNGCTYTLTGTTDAAGDAQAKVVCPAGAHITLTLDAIECVITVKETGATNGSQTAAEGVTYTNVGAGATREITMHLTAKVKVQSEQGSYAKYGVTCASLTCTTGRLTGTVTITGEEDVASNPKHVGIFTK